MLTREARRQLVGLDQRLASQFQSPSAPDTRKKFRITQVHAICALQTNVFVSESRRETVCEVQLALSGGHISHPTRAIQARTRPSVPVHFQPYLLRPAAPHSRHRTLSSVFPTVQQLAASSHKLLHRFTLMFKSATSAFTAASFVFAVARRSFASRRACAADYLQTSASAAATPYLALRLHSDHDVSVHHDVDNPRAQTGRSGVLRRDHLRSSVLATHCYRTTLYATHLGLEMFKSKVLPDIAPIDIGHAIAINILHEKAGALTTFLGRRTATMHTALKPRRAAIRPFTSVNSTFFVFIHSRSLSFTRPFLSTAIPSLHSGVSPNQCRRDSQQYT